VKVGCVDFQLNLDAETVDRAYPREPACVEPGATVREVLVLMKERRIGTILVCQDGRLVGIFTERDALRLMAAGFHLPPGDGHACAGNTGEGNGAAAAVLDSPIERVMTANPITLSPTDTVGKAITIMSSGGYRRLPITDEAGKPLGTVKTPGILRYLVEHFPKVIYTLPPTPHHTQQTREGA
jgi:CBS domain-containing protein